MRAHVEKRSKNRYTIIIDKGRKPDGSRDRVYISTELTNKRKAEEEADRILLEHRNGTYIPPSTLTFSDYLDMWLKDYGLPKLSYRTYAFYEEMFKLHTKPCLGSISLEQLTPLDLQRYYNYLRTEGRKDGKPGGLAESSIFKQHCIIHKALKTAVKWRLIRENPADFVERPKRPDSDVASFYEPEQAIKMLECAKESNGKYAILAVAVYSGARRAEIIGFRWQDIDWETNTLRIRQTVQYTKDRGVFFKQPKSKKGKRDIRVPDIEIARRAGHADPATPHRLYGHIYASMKDEATNAIEHALRIEQPKEPDPQPSLGATIITFPKKNLA